MSDLIHIEKPQIKPEHWHKAINYRAFLSEKKRNVLQEAYFKSENPAYLHWEAIKRKSWIPEGLAPEEFWFLIKEHRRSSPLISPIVTPDNNLFTWGRLPRFDETLHHIDLSLGGRVVGAPRFSESEKRKIISYRLIEEAIASSQMEGAHTTREVAKKMIQENRQPSDRSQRMILNNYKIMQRIENETCFEELSIDTLLDLQAELTKGTLDNPDQSGRFRRDDENIVVGNELEGQIAHIPPKMDFVKDELLIFMAFANDHYDPGRKQNLFIHPVIKAIILHFWMGYLHPFADGNGRMARAIFYWYLLRKGYWMFAFLPLSVCIKKSAGQYAKAYLYSEQDDFDLTYFIDYNMRKIEQAQRDFDLFLKDHFANKPDESEITRQFPELNPRQIQLIQFFRAKPMERTNMSSMIQIHGISSGTAVKDLRVMEDKGLLTRRKSGLNVFYYPTDKLLNGS